MITEEHHNLLSTSLGIGREVLDIEIAALENLRDRLNETVLKAVRIILNSRGKVITTGVGKSGFVAQKITAMLNSTGSPSVFLHPTEALHGDLGICAREDPVIMVSKSGTTEELLRLLPFFNEMGSPIIALVGNKYSYLAENSEVVLDVSVEREADPLALVPTTSCILAMAMGDVLASLLIKAKNYLSKDFARVHPAGQLGKNLHLTVEKVMHRIEKVATIYGDSSLREIVKVMTDKPLGAACVIDDNYKFLGIITEGDIRRLIIEEQDLLQVRAQDLMCRYSTVVFPEDPLQQALVLMEDRASQISVLPVLNKKSKELLGLIRIHDIYQPSLT